MFKKNIATTLLIIFLLTVPMIFCMATEINWPTSPGGTDISSSDVALNDFIQYIYEWGISLGGIAVFIMMVWSGIEYLTSAGDPSKMTAALNRIKSSILGLILLLCSWLILNTINPELVQLNELPDLWGSTDLSDININELDESAPPCDFVVVYPGVGYVGYEEDDVPKPLEFNTEPNEEHGPRIDIIKLASTQELNDAISLDNKEWASIKCFIELTEEEKNDYRLVKKEQRYDSNGKQNDGGNYKEGGLCMVDLFYTTKRWFNTNPCGGRLAKIQLPARDISELKYREESITCVEISRTVPAGWKVPPTDDEG